MTAPISRTLPVPRHAPLSRTPACLALIMAAERVGLIGKPERKRRPAPVAKQMELKEVTNG